MIHGIDEMDSTDENCRLDPKLESDILEHAASFISAEPLSGFSLNSPSEATEPKPTASANQSEKSWENERFRKVFQSGTEPLEKVLGEYITVRKQGQGQLVGGRFFMSYRTSETFHRLPPNTKEWLHSQAGIKEFSASWSILIESTRHFTAEKELPAKRKFLRPEELLERVRQATRSEFTSGTDSRVGIDGKTELISRWAEETLDFGKTEVQYYGEDDAPLGMDTVNVKATLRGELLF